MQHRNQIPVSVILFDGHGNEFEVAVVRRSGDFFPIGLASGWSLLGSPRWGLGQDDLCCSGSFVH